MATPYARAAAERDELRVLAEKRGEALMASQLMADALKRENEKLHARIKTLFDAICSADAVLDYQKAELARDILVRAKLAANAT